MEDFRKNKLQDDIKRSRMINSFFLFIKTKWLSILLSIIFIFILLFPQLSGELIGSWCNTFYHSLTKNILP